MKKLKFKHLVVELGCILRPRCDRFALAMGAGVMVGSLLSTSVQAQDTTQPPANAAHPNAGQQQQSPSNQGPATLSTVTVTAQKRSEALLSVPVPVAVVAANSLIQNDTLSLSDYYDQVPGLSYGRGNVSIRGITTGTFGNPTVGITVDDVPFGSTVANGNGGSVVPDIDPFDLQQIEVLRGPQGTLYGAASMGGLIKYETVDPQTDKFSGRVEVDTQNIDHGGEGYGVRGALNIPLSSTFAVRVSVFKREDPGYIENEEDHNDKGTTSANGASLSALWLPSENVSVKFYALQQNTYDDGISSLAADVNHVPLFGDYIGEQLPGVYDHRSTHFYDAHVDVDLGWGTFSSISGYSQDHITLVNDLSPIFGPIADEVFVTSGLGAEIYQPSTTNKVSQEFRLASEQDTSSKLEWQFGTFFTREQSFTNEFINPVDPSTDQFVGPLNLLFNSVAPSTYKEYALYGDLDYHFTDQFDIQVGGRYSKNSQTFSTVGSGILNGGTTDISGTANDHDATYLFSPRFKITDNVMVYGRIATGYRPGGANIGFIATPDVPPTYAPDKTTNYEVGLKGSFLDHQLIWDTSLYYIDWSHIQVLETSLLSGESYVGNAGKAKSQGIENTVTYQPSDNFSITANFVYDDAVLTQNFPTAGAYALSGERLPYSSKVSGSLSFDKYFHVSGPWKGFVGASFSYVGDRYQDFPASEAFPRVLLPSYTQTDIHGGVTQGHWTVSLYVRNLFDGRGFLGGGPRDTLSPTSTLYDFQLIQPRTFGMTASYKF